MPTDQDEPATDSPESPESVDKKPLDVVYIGGDTRDWKDRIKEYGARYGDSNHPPKRGYRWMQSELAWSVQYQAWKKLIEDHPKAADALQLKEL